MGDIGECQTSNKKEYDDEEDDTPAPALDEGDIALLKTYGLGPYTTAIKDVENDISEAKVGPLDYNNICLSRVKALFSFSRRGRHFGLGSETQWGGLRKCNSLVFTLECFRVLEPGIG